MRSLTSLEKHAWDILESLGYDVKMYNTRSPVDRANVVYAQYVIHRQYRQCPFRADFVLPWAKIIIEIDGEYWHAPYLKQVSRVNDDIRDQELRKMGWRVLRIPERMLSQKYLETRLMQILDLLM